jgi:hypothetical protein
VPLAIFWQYWRNNFEGALWVLAVWRRWRSHRLITLLKTSLADMALPSICLCCISITSTTAFLTQLSSVGSTIEMISSHIIGDCYSGEQKD